MILVLKKATFYSLYEFVIVIGSITVNIYTSIFGEK